MRSDQGTATDRYGRFALLVEPGFARLSVSHLGYETLHIELAVQDGNPLDIVLAPRPVELDAIAVSAQRTGLSPVGTDLLHLTPEEIERVPALAGETDLVRAIQLMPGVSAGREGSAGLFVRGGSPDQNLILLDGTPVYNATHLLGFLSTFSPDAVRSAALTKGAGSARYGGRLSSVVDVNLREGDRNERRTRGAIGLVSARVTTEGPIREGRAAYLVSVRRTYLDALWSLFQPSDEAAGYHFYDAVAKASLVSPRHAFYLSLYGGRDQFWTRYEDDYLGAGSERYDGALSWGNLTGTIRWSGQLSPRLLASASVGATSYGLAFDEETQEFPAGNSLQEEVEGVRYRSGVTDWLARADLDFRLSPAHLLRFGGSAALHAFQPSASRVVRQEGDGPEVTRAVGADDRVHARSGALYIEDEFESPNGLGGTVGVRASAFAADGRVYAALEPRLALRYRLPRGTAVEASYARSQQYVHLVSRSGVGVPLDVWLPTTGRVGPQQAWQAAFGATHEITSALALSIGVFYKRMEGLIEPAEGSSLLGAQAEGWEDRVELGQGQARGIELLLRKRGGRLTGWAAYTLAKSMRQFDAFDRGHAFPQRYDRRHDLAATASYRLTKRWELSGTWVYATGDAVWLPAARAPAVENDVGYPDDPFYEPAPTAYVYGPRNGTRAPAYHRLDVAARHTKPVGKGARTWTLGLYNAYGRRNPFFLYPRVRDDGRLEFRRLSPLVWIPAVSYERSF